MTKILNLLIFLLFFIALPKISLADALVASPDSQNCNYSDPCAFSVLDNDLGGTAPFVVATTSNPINGGSLDLSDNNFTYYAENNLTGTDSFTYEVTDASSSTSSATVSITIFDDRVDSDAPSAPTNLTAELIGGTYIRLLWASSTDNNHVEGYRVYKQVSGNYESIADIESLSYLDKGLNFNTAYTYKVSAYDEAGNEATSTATTTTTLSADSYSILLDTGLPVTSTFLSGHTLSQMSFAHRFEIANAEKITKLSAYIGNYTTNANQLTFAIYGDSNNSPNTSQEFATTSLNFTPSGINEVHWREKDGLDITLQAGTYWLAIEHRAGDNPEGFFPILKFDDWEMDRNIVDSGQFASSSEHGFRIYASSDIFITNIATSTSLTGATITWNTNKTATSTINYGTELSYGNASSSSVGATSHSIVLSGLSTSTTYNFKISSWGASGNLATSSNLTFTTLTPDIIPPILTTPDVPDQTTTTATIEWDTNELATSTLRYGTSLGNYGTSTTSNSFTYTHSFYLSGLSPETTYYYQVVSTDQSGNSTSSEHSFITLAPDRTKPILIVSPNSPTKTTSTARIEFETDELATSTLEYGTSSGNYGSSLVSNLPDTFHSFDLSGLTAGITYYYRVVSTDQSGNTLTSGEYSFTTSSETPAPVTPPSNNRSGGGGGGGGGGSSSSLSSNSDLQITQVIAIIVSLFMQNKITEQQLVVILIAVLR